MADAPGSAAGGPEARLTAREAVAAVTDTGSFRELPGLGAPAPGDGPIGWEGYGRLLDRAREHTGEQESVVCGTAHVGGAEAVLVSFDFRFLGGSLGERTGELLQAAHATARKRRLPVVSLVATGGSRLQEGMRALVQLQGVARESALTRAAGLAQLAVLRDPVTGGGWAALGAGADVILALEGAQVGFAGSRVRPANADPSAYTAESQLAAGQVDAVLGQADLRPALTRWLALLAAPGGPARSPVPPPAALGPPQEPCSGWEAVLRARSPSRPRAEAYLNAYFTEREPVRGDRCGGTDPGVLTGFGLHEGRTVAYAAQCGTPTTPAGFRTAARLIRLAGRLSVPVLTLVDTPGAANGAEAERSGAGTAIAGLFAAVADAAVPLTTLVIGEGGSGGALALTAPENTWVTPDSYFSVIAPEMAAAILKRGPEEAPSLAGRLRLRPQDLVELGVAQGIVRSGDRVRTGR